MSESKNTASVPITKLEKNNPVLRAAGAMGVATFLSRILGLVREQVFAYFFGAGTATDAFQIAFRIPNLLRDLFAEGAMSAALVPTFVRVREEQGIERAWRVAGLVFRVLFLFVSVISVIGIFASDALVSFYAASFKTVPGKFELTVQMTKILFPFFPLVALAAALMAVLNACGVFFIPSFSSALFNLVSITTGVALIYVVPRFGMEPIVGMAIGVVLGGFVQMASQLPSLYKKGYHFSKKTEKDQVWHKDPDLKRMLWLMVPGTLGLAATQINILVNSMLATSQGVGAVSWLNYAFRLMQFPIGIFGVSLAQATLPQVSKLWVSKDYTQFSNTLSKSIRTAFAINLPASAGLAFLGVPIIQLIFEYGRFRHEDTVSTAQALAFYAVGLVAYSAVKVIVPVFYALGNTKIPVISSVLAVFLNLIFNLIFSEALGFRGLALGTSLTVIINAVFLIVALNSVVQVEEAKISVKELSKSLFIHLMLALAMGFFGLKTHEFLLHWVNSRLVLVGVSIAASVIFWISLCHLFHIREAEDAVRLMTSKFKRILGRRKA